MRTKSSAFAGGASASPALLDRDNASHLSALERGIPLEPDLDEDDGDVPAGVDEDALDDDDLDTDRVTDPDACVPVGALRSAWAAGFFASRGRTLG